MHVFQDLNGNIFCQNYQPVKEPPLDYWGGGGGGGGGGGLAAVFDLNKLFVSLPICRT